MNEMDENVFLDIEGMENLLPHYNIYLQSRANVRAALQTIAQFLQNENTLDIKPSAKIGALVEQSVPKLMALIRKGEAEADQREREAMAHQQQMQESAAQAAQQLKETELTFEADQNEQDRQNQIDVAKIRALGGLQSDNDMNGEIDAAQNLDALIKTQQLSNDAMSQSQQLMAQKEANQQKMIGDQAKAQADLDKEIIKGEYALKVAQENRTAAEMKAKQAKKNKPKPKK
jgi:hypothetical protein